MKCPHCGKENFSEKFRIYCGTKLKIENTKLSKRHLSIFQLGAIIAIICIILVLIGIGKGCLHASVTDQDIIQNAFTNFSVTNQLGTYIIADSDSYMRSQDTNVSGNYKFEANVDCKNNSVHIYNGQYSEFVVSENGRMHRDSATFEGYITPADKIWSSRNNDTFGEIYYSTATTNLKIDDLTYFFEDSQVAILDNKEIDYRTEDDKIIVKSSVDSGNRIYYTFNKMMKVAGDDGTFMLYTDPINYDIYIDKKSQNIEKVIFYLPDTTSMIFGDTSDPAIQEVNAHSRLIIEYRAFDNIADINIPNNIQD